MKKNIYLLKLKCFYQNINTNKIGKKLVSKNKNEITIERCFTENTIEDLYNCEKSMEKILFEINKKTRKDIKITIGEVLESKFVSESNDIY